MVHSSNGPHTAAPTGGLAYPTSLPHPRGVSEDPVLNKLLVLGFLSQGLLLGELKMREREASRSVTWSTWTGVLGAPRPSCGPPTPLHEWQGFCSSGPTFSALCPKDWALTY